MKKELMTQVTNSIFEVMETMFFLTLEKQKDPAPAEYAADTSTMQMAAISFSGAYSGTIFLGIPLPLLSDMTESFMGEDISTLGPEYLEGTLKEALNMVAGSALTRVDSHAYMGLGIPEIVAPPKADAVDETVVLNSSQAMMIAHIKLH